MNNVSRSFQQDAKDHKLGSVHSSKSILNIQLKTFLAVTLALLALADGDTSAQTNQVSDDPATMTVSASSIDSLRMLAEQGNPVAQRNLGTAYRDGQIVVRDYKQALSWYQKAADQDDAAAQYCLGEMYDHGHGVAQDIAQAFSWYKRAAVQGNAEAQFCVGDMLETGQGVAQDYRQALSWYRKAADQGSADGQMNLGDCYSKGIGVEKDDVEATKWYRKAADQGLAQAQANLGFCYANGNGVQKSLAESAKWFSKAAEQGNTIAQYNLGLYYEHGWGVKKDLVEAAKWYRKAADQKKAQAQYNLGVCYYLGNGVEKDDVEATNWFRKAAEQGDAQAQYNLGICYMAGVLHNGTGLEKNPIEAAKWVRKAAEQGFAPAQQTLGLFFIGGIGLIKNEIEGLAWLYVSTANGSEEAGRLISSKENYYSSGTILAARERATEIQTQIASHVASIPSDSTAAIPQPIPPTTTPKASGSGAFISADGLVLTAAHVVEGAARIEVVTATGTQAATVVKIDANNDVALLKCTGSNFTPLPILSSKEARVAATVFTVGFPNIQVQGFDPKLTSGEISSQTGYQDDPREWQISVPIQPGNSGGPLCDENGNLIGIVEATLDPLKMAKLAGEIPQNVNYAMKSSYILPLLDDVQNLPQPRVAVSLKKFEDVVDSVRPSTVLILVY